MNVTQVIFSPTGGTRRAAELLAEGLGGLSRTIDLADPKLEQTDISAQELAVIALPSFGGRVPALAAQRLAKVRGNGAPCVLLCVYGNRAFEDTLVEMEDLAKAVGFRVVAAVAAIAEHSIAREVAAGRPNSADAAQLKAFGQSILTKLESQPEAPAPEIPGVRPYRREQDTGPAPSPTDACVSCGLCAKKCPAGAIDPADPRRVSGCVGCMGCVAVCPHHARTVDPAILTRVSQMLAKVCPDPKENELFL